jgi:predicted esterase
MIFFISLVNILFLIPFHFTFGEEEKIEAGKIHEKIACKDATQYSYACYLPKKYNPKEKYPILYCFSPGGEGLYFVQFYKDACENAGWIIVGSNDSKNGPVQTDAIHAMFKDTQKRFSFDKDWIYVSGFSGGSRVSTMFAPELKAKGHIAIGGVYNSGNPELPNMSYWLTCGETCFNRKEMERAETALKEKKLPVNLRIFPGGHQMPPLEVSGEAVKWLDGMRLKAIKAKAPCGLKKTGLLPFCSACNKILMGFKCQDCQKLFSPAPDAEKKCPECPKTNLTPAELLTENKCFFCNGEVKKELICIKMVFSCTEHPDEISLKNTSTCPNCKKPMKLKNSVYSRVITYFKCLKCNPNEELSEAKCPVCKKTLTKQKRCELSGSFPHVNEKDWK